MVIIYHDRATIKDKIIETNSIFQIIKMKEEITKTTSYKLKVIDISRFMAKSL